MRAYRPDLRYPIPLSLRAYKGNLFLKSIEREQKYLVFKTSDPSLDFVIHLGMSGVLRLVATMKLGFIKHDHFQIDFKEGLSLILNDPRRFGAVLRAADVLTQKKPPCALRDLTSDLLIKVCHATHQPIKNLLLNQEKISGLGNIYACEALFLSGIHPQVPANMLSNKFCRALCFAIKNVLEKAIYYGGTSLKDFKAPDQNLGYFQNHLWVYNREGKPCKKQDCQGTIQRLTQSGRSSFYCSLCQLK
jgi:formamidopyrimidine-DNA glycosylase